MTFFPPGWIFQNPGEQIHPQIPQDLGCPKGWAGKSPGVSHWLGVISGWDFGGWFLGNVFLTSEAGEAGQAGLSLHPFRASVSLGSRRAWNTTGGRESHPGSQGSPKTVFHDFKLPGFLDVASQTGLHQPAPSAGKKHLEAPP